MYVAACMLGATNIYVPGSKYFNILPIMINLRKSEDRGHANHGWLNTRFTFSFARYYDPEFMGFRSLRVLNDDRIDPGAEVPVFGAYGEFLFVQGPSGRVGWLALD